jgi:hypothetical protein
MGKSEQETVLRISSVEIHTVQKYIKIAEQPHHARETKQDSQIQKTHPLHPPKAAG